MKVKRLKDLLKSSLKYGLPESGLSEDEVPLNKEKIRYIRITDIQNDTIINTSSRYLYDINDSHILNKNDILFARSGATVGKTYIFDHYEKSTYAGYLIKLTLNSKNNPKYVYYYLNSFDYWKQIKEKQTSSTIENVNSNILKNIFITVHPKDYQDKIAKFLDENCSKINTEISLLEKKSKLLEEYKQSLIFETVTKGLDKNAKMKDSGVEWIGEIPEHWNVKRLKKDIKYLKLPKAKLNSSHYLEIGDINIYENSYDILGKDKLSVDNARICPENVILMSTVRPNRGAITITKYKHPISNAFCPLKGHKYWFYFVKCKGFLNEIIKLNMDTTYPTCKDIHIINQSVCIPSLQEKNEIVYFLEKEIPNIDKNINLINRKIELLKEYKQSLIHEAVTGQLEI